MGSRAMVEVVPVAGLSGWACSTSTSGAAAAAAAAAASARVSVRDCWSRGLAKGVRVNGGVVRSLMVSVPSKEEEEEEPRRSAFGRGWVSSRGSARLDVRVQATKQTFTSFDDMLKNCEVPVLVDFYAVWCGPCQMMVPILSEVSGVLKDKVRVVKIDTEKYPDLASRFNIHALPTLVLFKDGKVADRIEGVLRSEELVNRIQKTLGPQ